MMKCFYREKEIHLEILRDLSLIRFPNTKKWFLGNHLSVSMFTRIGVRLANACTSSWPVPFEYELFKLQKQTPFRCHPHQCRFSENRLHDFDHISVFGDIPRNNTASVASSGN
jgi:hypothetical protein